MTMTQYIVMTLTYNTGYYYPMLYLIKYYVFLTVPDNFVTSR